jgi:hypothetical protein
VKRANSKTIILLTMLFIAVLAGGMYYFVESNRRFEYNGKWYRSGEGFMDKEGCNSCSFDKKGQLQCTMMACDVDTPSDQSPADNDLIEVSFNYENGAYTYSGTIQTPTPCHTVETEQVIREVFPEDVDLKFTIQDSGEVCIEVIDLKEISGQITVSEAATIQVFVNDVPQPGQGVNEY